MIQKVKTAVFPVGGLGTRFLPATKSIPKEMLPVVDKPLIQYAFEQAQAAGIERFVFITGRNKNVISNHFDHVYELQRVLSDKEKKHLLSLTKDWLPEAGNTVFIRQQEPKGLGHAIYCARHFVKDEPFAVLLADEMFLSEKPFLQEMVELYEETGGNVISIAEVPDEDVSKYGIVDVGPLKNNVVKIKGLVEKPKKEDAPSNLSITGQYILHPDVFSYLSQAREGTGGEVQITDTLQAMLKKHPCHGVMFRGERFDCGGKEGWLEANIAFALARDDMRESTIAMIKRYAAKL